MRTGCRRPEGPLSSPGHDLEQSVAAPNPLRAYWQRYLKIKPAGSF